MIKIPKRYAATRYEDVPAVVKQFAEEKMFVGQGSAYLHGAVGTGKTHVAYALARRYDELFYDAVYNPRAFWNVTELMFEVRADFGRETDDRRVRLENMLGYRGLLVLDDIGVEKPTDFVAEMLYMIVNDRYVGMLPTLFTSNLPIGELAVKLGDRTASRITEMCAIFELGGNDRRMLRKF